MNSGHHIQPATVIYFSDRAKTGIVSKRTWQVVDAKGQVVSRHSRKRDAVAAVPRCR